METTCHFNSAVLQNGIRIIHKHTVSSVADCGIVINTGTRDENSNQHGLAHFTEHLLFKGTAKRKAFHLISRMEDVGGEIDAYTTKEETYISTSFLTEYYERAIELLNDMVFHSIFPQKEIEKEKEVIIDEINSYKDNPAEMIFDEFEELMYPNHQLGKNILGNKKQLLKYKTADIHNFTSQKYNTDQMVFCSIGNIKFDKLLNYCKKYFENNPANYRSFSRIAPTEKIIFDKKIKKNTYQAHCILGTYSYSVNDTKRIPLFLISNMLAGPGMSSKLSFALREKKGIAYNIESNCFFYEDTGIFNIYFGVDKENVNKATNVIFKELELLQTKTLGILQLSKIKKQLIGQLAISNEINSNTVLSIGKTYLVYNQIETLEDAIKEIEAITSKQILNIANEIFVKDNFSKIIYY